MTRPPDSDPREDAALVAATAGGDRVAFEVLYRRHLPWLLVRLGRRCSLPDLVDEVAQDTFVAVWRSARRWDGRGEVAAWIWGIGIRRLVDALRRSPRPTGELVEVAGHEGSAEDHVLLAVQYGDVGAALAGLSPELQAGGTGDCPRWADDAGGGPVAGHPGGHGEDPDDAGPGSAAGAVGMTTGGLT